MFGNINPIRFQTLTPYIITAIELLCNMLLFTEMFLNGLKIIPLAF